MLHHGYEKVWHGEWRSRVIAGVLPLSGFRSGQNITDRPMPYPCDVVGEQCVLSAPGRQYLQGSRIRSQGIESRTHTYSSFTLATVCRFLPPRIMLSDPQKKVVMHVTLECFSPPISSRQLNVVGAADTLLTMVDMTKDK